MDGRETDRTERPGRPGRPVKGADLVASLETGSDVAKARLEAILRTLEGAWTVEEGCAHLGIGRSAFNKMRQRFLERATVLLEPQKPGPSPKADVDEPAEVAVLQAHVEDLKLKVLAAEMREDLALAATPERDVNPPGSRAGKRGKKQRRKRR